MKAMGEMTDHSFLYYGIAFFGIILLRYFLLAGGFYWFLYGKKAPASEHLSPQRTQSISAIRHDVKLSVISAAVFALVSAGIMMLNSRGMTLLYAQPQRYGWWYLGLSYAVVLILQDAYFYGTHRLFHRRSLFPWFHRGHHQSRQPTPWTSFAFDPLEAIAQALFLIVVVITIPLHFITIFAVLSTMTVWAIINHLGLDRLPALFPHHWLGRWVIGPAHHSIHHRRPDVNFGLYFTYLDRAFGTEDPGYSRSFRPLPASPVGPTASIGSGSAAVPSTPGGPAGEGGQG
jgi:Delta7-sterol 5-desaturase